MKTNDRLKYISVESPPGHKNPCVYIHTYIHTTDLMMLTNVRRLTPTKMLAVIFLGGVRSRGIYWLMHDALIIFQQI